MTGNAPQDEQIAERVDDIGRVEFTADPDRQTLPGEFVDNIEHSILPPFVGAVLDEVVGPDMIGALRPQPDA